MQPLAPSSKPSWPPGGVSSWWPSLLLGLDQGLSTGPCVFSSAAMGYTSQCNWFLREERMSQIAPLLCCGLQDRGPRDLLNRWHCGKGPKSPYEKSDIRWVSWQIGLPLGQALTGCLGGLGRWTSLPPSYPHSAACRNISWRITDWWGAPNSHLGYSSRNTSVSMLCSASLNDSPTSIACSLAVWDLFILPHNVVPINCGN